LKLNLRPRAQLNLDQWIVLLHELAGGHQDVAHAYFKSDRHGMRLAGLGDHASVNNHFFGDGFSFHFRDLHLRDRASLFFLFSNPESLRDPNKAADNQHDRDHANDDSFLFHLGCNTLFVGR